MLRKQPEKPVPKLFGLRPQRKAPKLMDQIQRRIAKALNRKTPAKFVSAAGNRIAEPLKMISEQAMRAGDIVHRVRGFVRRGELVAVPDAPVASLLVDADDPQSRLKVRLSPDETFAQVVAALEQEFSPQALEQSVAAWFSRV